MPLRISVGCEKAVLALVCWSLVAFLPGSGCMSTDRNQCEEITKYRLITIQKVMTHERFNRKSIMTLEDILSEGMRKDLLTPDDKDLLTKDGSGKRFAFQKINRANAVLFVVSTTAKNESKIYSISIECDSSDSPQVVNVKKSFD